MADVVTSSDLRVFVHATELAHVRCPLPFAAASIRRLLARDDGTIPQDDAVALERAAEAIEELAGVPPPQPAANGHAAAPAAEPAAEPAAAPAAAEEQPAQKKKKEKKEKKRKAGAEEPAAAAPAAAEDGTAEKRKKKKRKGDARG